MKIRFILPLSFLIGAFSGFSKEFSEYMALGRIVCLLPFFLLGYYVTKEHVEKLRRIPKLITVAITAGTAFLSFYIVRNDIFKAEVLYLRKYFPESEEFKYLLFRILVYVVAVAMIITLINLTSNKRSILSKIGTGTMTVYVLHLFTVPILEKFEIFINRPILYLGYSVFVTVLITLVYSHPFVKRIYDAVMDKLTGLILMKRKDEN